MKDFKVKKAKINDILLQISIEIWYCSLYNIGELTKVFYI